jgi:hypothetical protein
MPCHTALNLYSHNSAKNATTIRPVTDYLLPDRWLTANPSHAWSIDNVRREERPVKRSANNRTQRTRQQPSTESLPQQETV